MEITPKIKFKNNKDFMNKKNIMFTVTILITALLGSPSVKGVRLL